MCSQSGHMQQHHISPFFPFFPSLRNVFVRTHHERINEATAFSAPPTLLLLHTLSLAFFRAVPAVRMLTTGLHPSDYRFGLNVVSTLFSSCTYFFPLGGWRRPTLPFCFFFLSSRQSSRFTSSELVRHCPRYEVYLPLRRVWGSRSGDESHDGLRDI